MHVEGKELSCLDYMREWLAKVNRDGLFCFSDGGYNLVVSIEILMQYALLKSSHTLSLEETKLRKAGIIETVHGEE